MLVRKTEISTLILKASKPQLLQDLHLPLLLHRARIPLARQEIRGMRRQRGGSNTAGSRL